MTFLERHKQTCMYLRQGVNDQTVRNPTYIYVNKVVNSLRSFTESQMTQRLVQCHQHDAQLKKTASLGSLTQLTGGYNQSESLYPAIAIVSTNFKRGFLSLRSFLYLLSYFRSLLNSAYFLSLSIFKMELLSWEAISMQQKSEEENEGAGSTRTNKPCPFFSFLNLKVGLLCWLHYDVHWTWDLEN